MGSGAFGDSIAITNDETMLPPCIGARINPNNIFNPVQVNQSCFQSLLPLNFDTDGWPTVLPRPRGITLDDVANVLGPDSVSEIYNALNVLEGGLSRNLSLFQVDCSIAAAIADIYNGRILSCKKGQIAQQNFYVTPGNNRVLQPMSVGCNVYTRFCPLFTGVPNLNYRFWTYHPSGIRPANADNKNNKTELYLWPGIHNAECGNNVTVLTKRACNIDSNGASCFRISSNELYNIINRIFPGIPVATLNVGVKWNISGANAISSWQTWIVINNSSLFYNSILAECFRTPIGV